MTSNNNNDSNNNSNNSIPRQGEEETTWVAKVDGVLWFLSSVFGKVYDFERSFRLPLIFAATLLLYFRANRRPFPCLWDSYFAAVEYRRNGKVLLVEEDEVPTSCGFWVFKRPCPEETPSFPPDSCDTIDYFLLLCLVWYMRGIYVAILQPFFVFMVTKINEKATVRVIDIKAVEDVASRRSWYLWRSSSSLEGRPTIKLDESCQLQVLRIECTTLEEVNASSTRENIRSTNFNGQVAATVAAGPEASAEAGFEYVRETRNVVESKFQRVVREYTVKVGCPWKFSGDIPKEGIEVRVRLEEDEDVIKHIYFSRTSPKKYICSHHGGRRIRSLLSRFLVEILIKFLGDTKALVLKNIDWVFKITQLWIFSCVLSLFLAPLFLNSILKIFQELKIFWRDVTASSNNL